MLWTADIYRQRCCYSSLEWCQCSCHIAQRRPHLLIYACFQTTTVYLLWCRIKMFLISRRKSFPLWVKNTFETHTSVPSTPPQIFQPPSAESGPRSGQMVWLASPCCWPLVPAQQSGAAAKQMENSGELKNPEICRGDSAGKKKKKHVFSELFVPIRCNFSLLVTLDVSVCLICPMWFQCRCRLQSRVNYIYFVMLASLFFHFISNQSACACVCMCVCGLPYIYTDIIITTSYSLQPSRAPMAPDLLHVFAAHIISLTGKRLFPHFLVFWVIYVHLTPT